MNLLDVYEYHFLIKLPILYKCEELVLITMRRANAKPVSLYWDRLIIAVNIFEIFYR